MKKMTKKAGIISFIIKQKKQELFLLLLIIILSVNASAGFVQNSFLKIDETGNASVLINIELQSNAEEFTLKMPTENVKELKVSDAFGELAHEMQGKTLKISLRSGSEKHSLKVEFESASFTGKAGEEWNFSYLSNVQADKENLKVEMPSKSRVTFFTGESELYFENGKMMIEWKNLTKEIVEITYSIEAEKEENLLENILMLIIGSVLLIGLGIFAWKNFRQLKKQFGAEMEIERTQREESGKELSDRKKDLMKTLSEKEKRIIEILLKNAEGINQKRLTRETELPKSTLSRTLKRLEERGFVKIAQDGYTKRISLSEWFLKK